MRTATLPILLALGLLIPLIASGQDGGSAGDSAPSMGDDDDDDDAADATGPQLTVGEPNIEPAIPTTLTMVDGTVHKGNLTHVLRAKDWYGHDPEPETGFTIAVDVHLLNLDWANVRAVDVTRPNTSSDMDCYSDEDKDPILWECTLKQVTAVKMRDAHQYAGVYRMDTREPYTFVFDNDPSTAVTVWMYKLVANTQSYESMSDALTQLQTTLKEKNRHSLKSIRFQ